jgi:hypothetical protein
VKATWCLTSASCPSYEYAWVPASSPPFVVRLVCGAKHAKCDRPQMAAGPIELLGQLGLLVPHNVIDVQGGTTTPQLTAS